MRVLVTGASGFVGNHVVEALLASGCEVVGLSRKAPAGERNKQNAVYFNGVNVADADSIKPQYFSCVDVVVHLVGIIMERKPEQTFQKIHVDGTRNVIQAAKQAGVKRIIYLSAIGSDSSAAAEYSRTKASAEGLVKSSGIPYVILRPSIIIGRDGEFAAQMSDLIKYGGLPVKLPFPFIPVPGSGLNKFQPIYIDDLTKCITGSLTDVTLTDRTVEIGGATQVTFNDLLDGFAVHLRVKKPKLHAPIPILTMVAPLVEMLPNPPFSRDQLKNLSKDNTTDIAEMKAVFHFEPITFEQSLAKIYA